ncbi:hypothetical protein EBT31_07835 [bacterium]|nr:hypothetical protein [bacterium]
MAQRRVLHGGYEPSPAFLRNNPAWRRQGGGSRPQGEATSLHHLLPRSRGGSNGGTNLVRLPHAWHEAWHWAFGLATPDEAVAWLQYDAGERPLEAWGTCEPSEMRLRALFPLSPGDFSRARLVALLAAVLQGNLVWSTRALLRFARMTGERGGRALVAQAADERQSRRPLRY